MWVGISAKVEEILDGKMRLPGIAPYRGRKSEL
jgi:hypothetical protein